MEENLISDHNLDVARSRASHRSCTELLQLDLLSAAAASAADQKRLRVITDQLGGSNPKPRQYSTFSGDQLECGSTTGLNGLTEKDSKPNAMTIRPYCRPTMSHGEISLKGFRRDMEDTVATTPGFYPGHDFFGVYDGHGGAEVAEVCRERMHALLAGEMRKNRSSGGGVGAEDKFGGGLLRRWWTEIMEASFKAVDAEVSRPKSGGKPPSGKTTGSTAVVAVVGSRDIVIANCGDCRAVLCRGGEAVLLSCDHKPNRPDELARIEAAGGRVIDWGGHRVLGVLATSRSIGDQFLKPYVTSEPEVTVTPRNDSDEFLILASDGLWDTVSNEAACAVARRCLAGLLLPKWTAADGAGGGGNAAEVAAAVLAQLAMSRGSRDNVSVVVVELKKLTGIGRRGRKGQALKRRNGESTCGIDS